MLLLIQHVCCADQTWIHTPGHPYGEIQQKVFMEKTISLPSDDPAQWHNVSHGTYQHRLVGRHMDLKKRTLEVVSLSRVLGPAMMVRDPVGVQDQDFTQIHRLCFDEIARNKFYVVTKKSCHCNCDICCDCNCWMLSFLVVKKILCCNDKVLWCAMSVISVVIPGWHLRWLWFKSGMLWCMVVICKGCDLKMVMLWFVMTLWMSLWFMLWLNVI